MFRLRFSLLPAAVLCFTVLLFAVRAPIADAAPAWKAGTAKAVITPKGPIWMAGYAVRTHPAEGTLHELCIRALALEDASGHRGVVLSSDLLGIPRSIAENVAAAASKKFGLSRDQLMLNASHTHCGPVLRGALYDTYPIDDGEKKRIEAYSKELETTIVRAIGEALSRLTPATLEFGQGATDFAVNRRNNREPDVPALRAQNALRGPSDHSLPVLAVREPGGKLLAAVFSYACHNTTLGIYQWNGDYAGFAETNLEQAHPGATALFVMGCGGDQNPVPRRTVELCRKYGQSLSDAVEMVLARRMQALSPTLRTGFDVVTLHLGKPPTRAELKSLASGKESYITRWSKRLLAEMDQGRSLARTYPYPIEVWQLGGRQLWIALGGEVVVDYSFRLKDRYGAETWVTAYANDVMAYIPSLRVLREDLTRSGGYEGHMSMLVYGMPAERWGEDVEELIASGVDRLVRRVAGETASSK